MASSTSMPRTETEKDVSYAERESTVLDFFDEQLAYYKSRGTRNRRQYYLVQSALLILSGSIPILVYASDRKLLQAIPAAIVAVLAGMNNFFRFRENWIKNINAAQALSIERVRYKARSTSDYSLDLDPQVALDNFMTRVTAIAETALIEWRALISMTADPNQPLAK